VITDRLTARVLGLLLLVMGVIIDVSCLVFVKPELRSQPPFVVMVLLPSIPIFVIGVRLLQKAQKLKD
jgi:hypothetical protein